MEFCGATILLNQMPAKRKKGNDKKRAGKGEELLTRKEIELLYIMLPDEERTKISVLIDCLLSQQSDDQQ